MTQDVDRGREPFPSAIPVRGSRHRPPLSSRPIAAPRSDPLTRGAHDARGALARRPGVFVPRDSPALRVVRLLRDGSYLLPRVPAPPWTAIHGLDFLLFCLYGTSQVLGVARTLLTASP